jgi:hypothetical protein
MCFRNNSKFQNLQQQICAISVIVTFHDSALFPAKAQGHMPANALLACLCATSP